MRRGLPSFVAVLCVAVLLPALLLAGGPAKPQGATFTITSITADAEKREVTLEFDCPMQPWSIIEELKFLPPVNLETWNARQSETGNGIVLKGDFRFGARHYVLIPDGLEVNNKTYVKTIDDFEMPHKKGGLSFEGDRTVVELTSRQLLHLKVMNLDEVLFEGIRVPAVLLPMVVEGVKAGSAGEWDALKAKLTDLGRKAGARLSGEGAWKPFLGEVFEERQLFYTAGELDRTRNFTIPLQFRRDKARGALELIRVRDNSHESLASTDATLFRITDLGLTYKAASESLLVWVTSLNKALPVKDASILGFTEDLAFFPLGKTGADGVLLYTSKDVSGFRFTPAGDIEPVSRRLEAGEIRLMAAAAQGDVSFIRVAESANLKPEGIDQIEKVGEKRRLLRGQVFTERGVYRPGETAHFKGVVREYADGKVVPPAEKACLFEITNSKGEKVYSESRPLTEFGSASGDLAIPKYFPMGTYTLALKFGPENKLSAERSFEVQEFREPRHFAEVALSRSVRPDDSVVNAPRDQDILSIDIKGTYYAGGPVKHGQVRWKISYAGVEQDVPEFQAYAFGYPADEQKDLLESGEAVLDEAGALHVDFPLDNQVLSGKRGVEVTATVVDFDGRAASETRAFTVRPDMLIGVGAHPSAIEPGETVPLSLVVVDGKGKLSGDGVLGVAVMRQEGIYLRKRNEEGDVYWVYQQTWKRQFATEVPLKKGEASYVFECPTGLRFLLVFTYRDGRGIEYTSATQFETKGDIWGWDYENKEKPFESLILRTDKETYRPGDKARLNVAVRRPVRTYLLTLERNDVLEYKVIDAARTKPPFEAVITRQHEPNVYMTLLGLTSRGAYPLYSGAFDEEAPTFVFGAKSVMVQEEGGEALAVTISGDRARLEARPGEEVTLDLAVADAEGRGLKAELAVGVVNESVLALTAYKTPELDDVLKFTHPLSVFTGEIRRMLLFQTPFRYVRNEPLTGGGGLDAADKGPESRIRKDFNPTAYFNPSVVTGEDGRATVTFRLPDTMTTYRVYAVANDKGGRFASSDKALLVTEPFYLEPGLPRYFVRGDRFSFAVSAFNRTDNAGAMSFAAAPEGGITLSTEKPSYRLEPQDSTRVTVTGQASSVGPARATFKGDFGGLKDTVELSLPVHTDHVLESAAIVGTFNGRTTVTLALPEAFVTAARAPGGVDEIKASIVLTGAPFIRMAEGLTYLLHYPYGCVEQTSSGVIALSAVANLVKKGLVPGITQDQVDGFVKAGVDRLLGMQREEGGFGYWPGYREPSPWGSVYAASALTFAREAGFKVADDRMDQAMAYLKGALQEGEVKKDDSFKAYAAYILAQNGKFDAELFNALATSFDDQGREGRLLILIAAKKAGLVPEAELKAKAREALSSRWEKDRKVQFWARYREPAIALLAASEILGDDPLTNLAAGNILQGVTERGIWSSTSDTGWCLYALSRHLRAMSLGKDPVTVGVSIGAEGQRTDLTFKPEEFRGADLDPKGLATAPALTLDTPAAASLFYKVSLNFPRVEYNEKGHRAGFSVSKQIRNTDGSDQIRVGDIVKVQVLLESDNWSNEDVMIEDPLPAGLVAINSAFRTEEPQPSAQRVSAEDYGDYYDSVYGEDGGGYRFQPNFFEIRDDRVLAYREYLWKGAFVQTYYARAVCEGEFVMPPTKVSLMYRPEVNGYSSASVLRVLGR